MTPSPAVPTNLVKFPSASSVCLSGMSTLNCNPSQSAKSDAEAGVDSLLYMRRPTDTSTAEPLSPKSTETGTTDATRQSPAPGTAYPKPCCRLNCNYFSMLCRSCDVSSSDVLDEPLVVPPLAPHSVRDQSFIDATGVPAIRMGGETRTGHVVSLKAAGGKRSAPCQKDPKRPRREPSGCLLRAQKTPRAAWQILEKEQFLKRAAALCRKGESTAGIVGGGISIQGSPLNRQAVDAHKGLFSVAEQAGPVAEKFLSSRLIVPQPCSGCPPQVAEAAERWLRLIGGAGGAGDGGKGAWVGGGGGTRGRTASTPAPAAGVLERLEGRRGVENSSISRGGEGGKDVITCSREEERRGSEDEWLEMSLGVGGGRLGDGRRPRLDIDLNL